LSLIPTFSGREARRGVSKRPGAMVFTLIPTAARSRARGRVIPDTQPGKTGSIQYRIGKVCHMDALIDVNFNGINLEVQNIICKVMSIPKFSFVKKFK
jgi:hypothetical protein